MLISAINLGNHGKPQDIKRMLDRLTRTRSDAGLSVDAALKAFGSS